MIAKIDSGAKMKIWKIIKLAKNRFCDENDFLLLKRYGKMIRGKWRHVRGKQVTLHFKRCGLKKYGKMKCLMTSMSGIELCHALTIVFYNANSHLVVCRLKYLGFQYYHEWNYGSIYVRKVWRCQRVEQTAQWGK